MYFESLSLFYLRLYPDLYVLGDEVSKIKLPYYSLLAVETKHLCFLIHIIITCNAYLSPTVICSLTIPRWWFFCEFFLLFMFHVCLCYAVLSVPCSLVVACWGRAGLLAALFDVILSCFCHFPIRFPG